MEQDNSNGVEQEPRTSIRQELLDSLIALRRLAEEAGLNPSVVTQMSRHLDRGKLHELPATSLRQAVKQAFQDLHRRYEKRGKLAGLPTGLTDFDDLTSGLQPGNFIVVGGRPSMGCSTLALNIAEFAAMKEKMPVLIFSMDLAAESIAQRMMASVGRIDQQHLRNGDVQEEEWPRVTSSITLLSDAPVFIVDTRAPSIAEICENSHRLTIEHDIGLIVIDDLQSIKLSRGQDARAAEIREILQELKTLAEALGIPVLTSTRLDNSIELRSDKRPVIADLGEWACVERQADVIAFLYRDEYYNVDSQERGIAQIHIARQRGGPTGSVYLTFLGRFAKFESFRGQLD